MPRRSTEHLLCLGLFSLSIILNLVVSGVGLRNSLQEIHEFRQVQTALTARCLQESGFSLAYPTPLFGPPWSAPLEFPIYQQIVAQTAKLTGWPLEPTGRVVSMAFLYLALPACFGLAGLLGLSPARRWLLLSLILLSPAYIYYSRSFMIESTALCAALWFLYAYLRALAPRANGWLAAASFFCLAAALAKVTTLIAFLVVGAVYTLWLLRAQRVATAGWTTPLTTALRALVATVPGVALGFAWVRYSDAIKDANPLAHFLSSGAIGAFTYGTLAQRLSLAFWARILHQTSIVVVAPFGLALIVIFALLLGTVYRRRTLLLILGFLVGPLVLANLYFVHDYYFYASGVFLLGAVALAWSQLLDSPGFSMPAKWSVIVLTLGLQFVAYLDAYFPAQFHPWNTRPPELGRILAAATEPEDVLLVFGQDWDPQVSYYSHRRAVMVTDGRFQDNAAIDEVLGRMPPDQVTALVVTGELRKYTAFFQPLIQRLHLHPSALLVSANTVVFLAERRLAAARARLDALALEDFHFAANDGPDAGVPRVRYPVAKLTDSRLTDMMTPRPVIILHPFEPATQDVDGKNTFNAHAPTDIIFDLPPGAKGADAEFGILPSAYAGKNATDGVEFRVELVTPDGIRHALHSVYLSPSFRPVDRGSKTLHVALPPDAKGQLWFRTLPGPTHSIACAWAYWARIDVK